MTRRGIAVIAGEPSGDLIASSLAASLTQQSAHHLFGIGGPRMRQAGVDIRYPMDALSVFGYVDALKQLPRVINTYRGIKAQILQEKPAVFVGVDAPDFNLRLEHTLRRQGIPTVHLVSPSIWAWRYERIHKIRESVDCMLCLFPFEEEIYRKEGVPARYIGHPIAQRIPLNPNPAAARARLGLPVGERILAILPGSRGSELKHLSPVFLETALRMAQADPHLHFAVPLVNDARKAQFTAFLAQRPVPNLHIFDQTHRAAQPISWEIMEACDAALTASGTAALELSLFKKPMVIAYILTPLMLRIMQWRAKQERPTLPWIGLPNILLRDFAVPEILQEEVTPQNLQHACERALHDETYRDVLAQRFDALHRSLHLDTSALAAEEILRLAQARI